MIREIDKRNFAAFEDTDERKSRFFNLANETSTKLDFGDVPLMADINAWTGNPSSLKTSKPVNLNQGSLIEKALNYIQMQKQSFGFEETEPASYLPDPYIANTSTGHSVVNMQQVYKGIPVFLVNKSVVFNPGGEIEETLGDSVSFPGEIDIEPRVTVLEAAEKAADAIISNQEEIEDGWGEVSKTSFAQSQKFEAKKLVEFPGISCRPTVLQKSIFANYIRANLIIFYIGPQAVLAWYFTIEVDDKGLQCDVVISANDTSNIEILYLKKTSHSIVARGNVFKRNGGEPREWVNFPVNRNEYPIPANGDATVFKEWVIADETNGINVVASLGNMVRLLQGVHNNILDFDPSTAEDQRVLNMFYFCNLMHDFFSLLGFNKASGSFEDDDPVLARAFNTTVSGTANMITPVDGSSPVMNMGLVASSGLHTALDADVVFHEYVHGVTNRLVGGRVNDRALVEEQSRAMGEGWSDYFALTLQNISRTTEKVIIGDWVKGSPGGAGIRSRPYDDSFNLTYSNLAGLNSEHSRGEVWCATLMHWTRHLAAVEKKEQAYYICWQAVIDGLKLTSANPSFLDARDGIMRALNAMASTGSFPSPLVNAAINQFRISFAKFGMGVNASSQGPSVVNIKENFDTGVPELADNLNSDTILANSESNKNEMTPNSADDIDAADEINTLNELVSCKQNASPKPWKISNSRLAGSLIKLREQINKLAPNRSKKSDGWFGDAAHQTRNSDHNPWVDGSVVTAIDITHAPNGKCDCEILTGSLVDNKDSRIKYIIWNRRIVNSSAINGTPPWVWRHYNGVNPHDKHAHISVKCEKTDYDSPADWLLKTS
jgi:extracellular elastinolytic metalloproteinase